MLGALANSHIMPISCSSMILQSVSVPYCGSVGSSFQRDARLLWKPPVCRRPVLRALVDMPSNILFGTPASRRPLRTARTSISSCESGMAGRLSPSEFGAQRFDPRTENRELHPAKVCRAPVGPGLWPGPRRQARWGARGSAFNGAPKVLSAERKAPLRLEGPARTMRGVPPPSL